MKQIKEESTVNVKTVRFGELKLQSEEIIDFPEGILGFTGLKKFCLVDPGDETLILWLQSLEDSKVAFPVLEPKVFKTEYIVKLSGQELRQLQLSTINQSIVFAIITIPKDVQQMTANLKAPIVVNLKEQIGKQVVLQENEYTLKHLMFKELKAQLTTIQSNKDRVGSEDTTQSKHHAVSLKSMLPCTQVQTL